MPTFDLIGSSAKFRVVLEQINMVAPVDSVPSWFKAKPAPAKR